MTVVQADGNDVEPVTVDEFRIGIAETYDVIVQPQANTAYTIFAQSEDRSGYARGTLAPSDGYDGRHSADGPTSDAHDDGHGHGQHEGNGSRHGGYKGMDM